MKKLFSILTILGLVLGVVVGLNFQELAISLEFIGTWYIKILKVFITPVLFTSIAYTIYETSKKKNGLIIKSVLLFTLMYTVTFLLTSIIVYFVNPANGFAFEEISWEGARASFKIKDILLSLLPKNLADLFINPKVFFVIFVAYVVGKIGSIIKGSEKVFEKINILKNFINKLLGYFMYVTPIATLSLMATTISKYGYTLLGVGFKYILIAWTCGLITMIVVMILPVSIFKKISPLEYIKKVYKVWIMTLSTCSSAATLPYTVKVCKEEFNVDAEVSDVVVPLGCTIHMCGGAVSFALLGLFSAKLYGVSVSFGLYLLMLISSLLINTAAPGIPGGGIVIGATFLELLGIPLGFIGFYSGIYKFLDMCYTTLNVTGDITANILLDKEKL